VDSSTDEESAGGKESSNLVVLLTELYNFQLVSCVLMYDIVRELLDGGLEEFDVELLSKIMRSEYHCSNLAISLTYVADCGNQLRQDDPSALKDIVQIVQTRVSGQENARSAHDLYFIDPLLIIRHSSRTRFMLETLVNLKNNRLKKTGNAGQTGGNEAVERMKKFLTGLEKKRHGSSFAVLSLVHYLTLDVVLAHEPIRVSLTDLRSADTKGKWWIVGAAWGGDPLVERQDRIQREEAKPAASSENTLLKLAKKQGMNTDIRRSIFVVLMSSEVQLHLIQDCTCFLTLYRTTSTHRIVCLS
jgi:nucleolar MIF4G domain-containing protein 1